MMKKHVLTLCLLSLLGVMSSSAVLAEKAATSPEVTAPDAAAVKPITEEEISAAQQAWGDALVAIGKAYQEKGDYKALASELLDKLYAFDDGKLLFKPTKASEDQFRETKDEALSYFVTGKEAEDHGFALKPWSKVRFENDAISINQDTAEAMGNYFFTDAATGEETKVEYTFGYKRDKADGHLKIFLHHSSLPYHPEH